MDSKRTILVTGANRGLGKALVELILKNNKNGFKVILGCRKIANGEEAIKEILEKFELKEPTPEIETLEIDLSNNNYIESAVKNLDERNINLDALVNNSGIFIKGVEQTPEIIQQQLQVNYLGPRYLIETLLEKNIFKNNAKILNCSSRWAQVVHTKNVPKIGEKLMNYKEMNLQDLDRIFEQYLEDVKIEEKKKVWPDVPYFTSKMFLSLFTYLFSQQKIIKEKGIQIYSYHPGWCRTDMTNWESKPIDKRPPKSAEEGCETPMFLLGLDWQINEKLQGGFFREKQLVELNEEK